MPSTSRLRNAIDLVDSLLLNQAAGELEAAQVPNFNPWSDRTSLIGWLSSLIFPQVTIAKPKGLTTAPYKSIMRCSRLITLSKTQILFAASKTRLPRGPSSRKTQRTPHLTASISTMGDACLSTVFLIATVELWTPTKEKEPPTYFHFQGLNS